jgi:2',3'-cyclic-nucleotide 2'-phosphodiesterase (5'-nucleotidase family)
VTALSMGESLRNGDGDDVYEAGEIVPLTILHHNDSHGNIDKTTALLATHSLPR